MEIVYISMMNVIEAVVILLVMVAAIAVAWFISHARELRLMLPFGVSLVAIA